MALPLHVERPISSRRGPMALAIKRRTATEHRAAEAAVLAYEPFASRERYTQYLARLYGFYVEMEPKLEVALRGAFHTRDLLDMRARAKAGLLADDLVHLGLSRAAIDALPRCRWLPRMASPAAAFGVAYVLEGKTLGARFLLAEARVRLALDVRAGASFLAGYGERTASMWNELRARLEAFVDVNGRRTTVLCAARETFASFIRWLPHA